MSIIPSETAILMALLKSPADITEIIRRICAWTGGEVCISRTGISAALFGWKKTAKIQPGLLHDGMVVIEVNDLPKNSRNPRVFKLSTSGRALAEKHRDAIKKLSTFF